MTILPRASILLILSLLFISNLAGAAGIRDSGGAPPPPKHVHVDFHYSCHLYLWENDKTAIAEFEIATSNSDWGNRTISLAPQDWHVTKTSDGAARPLATQVNNQRVNFSVLIDDKKRVWIEAEIQMHLQFGGTSLETSNRVKSLLADDRLSGDANLSFKPNQQNFSLSLDCQK